MTLVRRHSVLARLVPNIAIPSAADEAKDRGAANATYASCVAWLIARTRDDRLLLQENINYGFRRNLWGLKPWGLTIATSATIVLGLRLYLLFVSHLRVSPFVVVFEVCNVLMIAFWVRVVSTAWAMIPARAYAERLFDALDRLESTQ
jgi:hypothetical protein